jgi:hypothetical protein
MRRWRWWDALAPGIDLAPLGELLADAAVMKVFHAARQDVESSCCATARCRRRSRHADRRPGGGFGDQVSYDALARALAAWDRQGAPLQRLVGAPALARADRLLPRPT